MASLSAEPPKVFSLRDNPNVQSALVHARTTHSGVIKMDMKWFIAILGFLVFALVMYLYFRNSRVARGRLRNQTACQVLGSAIAAQLRLPLTAVVPQPANGSTVSATDTPALYNTLLTIMNSGADRVNDTLTPQVMRVRVIDAEGNVYADNAIPENALRPDGNMPATNIATKRTADTDKSVLEILQQTAAKGGGFVALITEDVRAAKNTMSNFYVEPVKNTTWMIVVDVPQ